MVYFGLCLADRLNSLWQEYDATTLPALAPRLLSVSDHSLDASARSRTSKLPDYSDR